MNQKHTSLQKALLVSKLTFFVMGTLFLALAFVKLANIPTKAMSDNFLKTSASVAHAADQADALVHDARLTLDVANKTAIQQRLYWKDQMPVLTQQVSQVLDSTDKVAKRAETTLNNISRDSGRATTHAALLLDNASNDLKALSHPIQSIDMTVTSLNTLAYQLQANVDQVGPSIVETARNTAQISEKLKTTVDNANRITSDVAVGVDTTVHHCNWFRKFFAGCPTKENTNGSNNDAVPQPD